MAARTLVFNYQFLAIPAIWQSSSFLHRLHRRYRDLLNNSDPESFQRCYSLRMIGEQAYGMDVQAGKNLRADADFALGLSLVRRRCLPPLMVKGQPLFVIHIESL